MKVLKKRNLIFISLSVVIFIACFLPVLLHEDAAISPLSAPAIVFGLCSAVYAMIAFLNREKGNLFVLGKNKLFVAFLYSLNDDRSDADSDECKKEFALSAFIFCASLPLYMPLAFFAKSYYTAVASVLLVTSLRILCTFVSVLIPRTMKHARDKKQDRMKDEADKKEQEHRESMGKWK